MSIEVHQRDLGILKFMSKALIFLSIWTILFSVLMVVGSGRESCGIGIINSKILTLPYLLVPITTVFLLVSLVRNTYLALTKNKYSFREVSSLLKILFASIFLYLIIYFVNIFFCISFI